MIRPSPSHPRSLSLGERRPARLCLVVGGALVLGACVVEDPTPPGAETDGTTTSAGGTETAGMDDATEPSTGAGTDPDAGSDDSTEPPPPPSDACNDPMPVPASPFDCTGAEGVVPTSVIIEAGGDDPSILEGVRRVEGSIRINATTLTNLDFMGCVEEVTGDVTIYDNDALTDVAGLWSLTSIGTDFVLSNNDGLVLFDGLPNVTVVPRNVVVKNNGSLESLRGFHQLEEIGANLLVQQNDALRDVDGLGGLRTLGNVFAITANPSLCITSVNCVGEGITDPAAPLASWSAQANDVGC